jgi:hypothetical protein
MCGSVHLKLSALRTKFYTPASRSHSAGVDRLPFMISRSRRRARSPIIRALTIWTSSRHRDHGRLTRKTSVLSAPAAKA